jgi:hypothetical protein
MKIIIESTDDVVVFNGRNCRRWQGVDEAGQRVQAFIAAVAYDGDNRRAAAELVTLLPPDEDDAIGPILAELDRLRALIDDDGPGAHERRLAAVQKLLTQRSLQEQRP